MNFIKKCIECGKEFEESEISYRYNFCDKCGSKLELKDIDITQPEGPVDHPNVPEWPEINGGTDNEMLLGDILTIDSLGYIHIVEECENCKTDEAQQSLQIFINDKLINSVPIIYDETTIGRNSISFNPDIDLGKIDPERMVSRKHAMIYRANGEYYLRNLSSKNTLHLNENAIMQDESQELNDGDLIIFSNYIVAKFIKSTY